MNKEAVYKKRGGGALKQNDRLPRIFRASSFDWCVTKSKPFNKCAKICEN